MVPRYWSPKFGRHQPATTTSTQSFRNTGRGDLEIWRLHPYDRTLTVWRRQDDGSYETFQQAGGTIQPIALPGVVVDLDALFD